MKYPLIFTTAVVLCMAHAGPSAGEPPHSPISISSKLTLTPFKVHDGEVQTEPARRRSAVVKSSAFTVVIVASWCPYSQALLKEIADGTSELKPDLIVFKESEIDDVEPTMLKRASDEAEVSEVKDWARARRQARQLLVDPAAVEHELPYYFAPNSQLKLVNYYPAVLRCNEQVCAKMSLRDRLNMILEQGGMEPLGKR
jgi:hypothetical protein